MRIPEGVREVIGRRLNRLSQRCNQTLAIASIIGREFSLGQLNPLVKDLSEDRLLEVLEEALSARIIDEMPQAIARYQFTHALIQETLAGELTMTRRVRLHAQIAEALEALYGADSQGHAAVLAHHFAEAEAVLGNEKLVHYSLIAGEKALASYANEDALAHFERALDSKSDQSMDNQTAKLLFGLARAQGAMATQTPQFRQAFSSLKRAFDYYVETGDVPNAVTSAAYQFAYPAARIPGLIQLVSKALDLVPPESREAGQLLSRYVGVLGVTAGDYEGAKEAIVRGLAIAQREGDSQLEMQILASAVSVSAQHLNHEDCLAYANHAIQLSEQMGASRSEIVPRIWAATSLVNLVGNIETARLHLSTGLSLAERFGDRNGQLAALATISAICLAEGDWQTAREFVDRGLAVDSTYSRLLANRTILEFEVGDYSRGEVYMERILENFSNVAALGGSSQPTLAIAIALRITGRVNNIDLAKKTTESVLRLAQTLRRIKTAEATLALLAIQQGDASKLKESYDALLPLQGSILETGLFIVDHLLGLLAHTRCVPDQAVAHFEDALIFCRRTGFRPELAWTCCDYADTLLQRDNPGDSQKAMSLLDESLAISSELGMKPLMQRVLSRREILKA